MRSLWRILPGHGRMNRLLGSTMIIALFHVERNVSYYIVSIICLNSTPYYSMSI